MADALIGLPSVGIVIAAIVVAYGLGWLDGPA
jgi:hypothetical protein